ncbi:hypothetical protein BDN72DRAFT_410533 [Pluteus cervinus]|uniref:Uncharacterized protein n=1 Tax=Pluteus cervinus TaxID=181527 RepID=A0ACD3B1X3_9AGAR|nr:hypothetical protein BDN72DRAFT_410533 [Pluteus cervinus]
MDVHVEPRDEFSHWFPEATSAAIRLYVGRHYYTLFRRGGQRQHLKLARTTLEGALEDPIIDPGLSQVLEAVIPFLYCIEQGYSSCLDVALEVLQTFPGLDGQFDAQLLLHMVVHDIGHCFEWYDHVPQIIKSITGPLKLLLHSASPRAWKLLVAWVTLAHSVARDAMEVLPLMDLVVDFHSGFSGSEGFELLPIMRATVYFKQAVNPGGPSLSTALGAADFVMYSLAGRELSPHLGPTFGLVFVDQSIAWLLVVLSRNLTGTETMPQKDRLLSFVTWLLSNLPFKLPPELQGLLREIRSCLRGNACRLTSEMVKGGMSRPPTLDDNDNQFIEETFQDLHQQTSGKEIPTEYPKGKLQSPSLSYLSSPFRCSRAGKKLPYGRKLWVKGASVTLRNGSDDFMRPSSARDFQDV